MNEAQKEWSANKKQALEQELTNKALKSRKYDKMTDAEWCRYLERGGNPARQVLTKEVLEKLNNYDWMRNQYLVKNKTLKEISSELNISINSVGWYAKKHLLFKPRSKMEANTINGYSVLDLENLYWSEQLTIPEISENIGVSKTLVRRFFERHKIPRRTKSETIKLQRKKRVVPSWNMLNFKKQPPLKITG